MCRSSAPTDGAVQTPSQQQGTAAPPFTIRRLNKSTYLIRENDIYGEHPHIYAKLHHHDHEHGNHPAPSTTSGRNPSASLIILIDTGVGTTLQSTNLWTFLSSTINPSHALPYLIILTHCHYDHILGMTHVPPTGVQLTIAASSHDRGFVTPYSALQEHSLCAALGLRAPRLEVAVWLRDGVEARVGASAWDSLEGGLASGEEKVKTGLIALHTPGHTPDSLSVYDEQEGWLYVGDSFYAQTSRDTEGAAWGKEEVAPIVFPKEGDLRIWWGMVVKLVGFVEEREREIERGKEIEGGEGKVKRKVLLAAGHVTAGVEAYGFLLRVRAFMGRVLRGDIEVVELPEKRGERTGWWAENENGKLGDFSLVAPLRVIADGRREIPGEEWR